MKIKPIPEQHPLLEDPIMALHCENCGKWHFKNWATDLYPEKCSCTQITTNKESIHLTSPSEQK